MKLLYSYTYFNLLPNKDLTKLDSILVALHIYAYNKSKLKPSKQTFADHSNIWSDSGIVSKTSTTAGAYATAASSRQLIKV